MRRNSEEVLGQGHLFLKLLKDLVSPRHPMVQLADCLNWEKLVSLLEPHSYCLKNRTHRKREKSLENGACFAGV